MSKLAIDEFRKNAKEVVDFVGNYLESMRVPNDEDSPNDEGIMGTVGRDLLPGSPNWNSLKHQDKFLTSNPAIVADMMSAAVGDVGITWTASPKLMELENFMMDRLANMLQLPESFIFSSGGKGGGTIYDSCSQSNVMAMSEARNQAVSYHMKKNPELTRGTVMDKLVGFCSQQAHGSASRGLQLGGIQNVVQVKCDGNNSMRGDALKAEIEAAVAKGLIPFFVVCTLGTTNTCAFDRLNEIGPVVDEYNQDDSKSPIWLHVDAAYVGSSFICQEFRPILDGVEYASSFSFNPSKWLLVDFECSAMWFADVTQFQEAFNSHRSHLIESRNRRFWLFKLFFVLRIYKFHQLQDHIRKQVGQATLFKSFMLASGKYELTEKAVWGVICFRLKPTDDLEQCNIINKKLLEAVNQDNRVDLSGVTVNGVFMLHFVVSGSHTTDDDIKRSWDIIEKIGDNVLVEN